MKPEAHAEQPFFATMQQFLPDLHCAFQVLSGVLSDKPKIKSVMSNTALSFPEIKKELENIEFIDERHHSLKIQLLRILTETQEILTVKKSIFEKNQLGAEFLYSSLYPHHDQKKRNIIELIKRCSRTSLWVTEDKVRDRWRARASMVARKARAVRSSQQQQGTSDLLAEGIALLQSGHPNRKRDWESFSEVARYMAIKRGHPERKMADLLRKYARNLTASERSLLRIRRKPNQK